MDHHASEAGAARIDQRRREKIEAEMLHRDRQRRRHDDAPVGIGHQRRQHGEIVHVEVDLPGMALERRDAERDLHHQRHRERHPRDKLALGHDLHRLRKDRGAEAQKSQQRKARPVAPGEQGDDRHMEPQEGQALAVGTAAVKVETLIHGMLSFSEQKMPFGRLRRNHSPGMLRRLTASGTMAMKAAPAGKGTSPARARPRPCCPRSTGRKHDGEHAGVAAWRMRGDESRKTRRLQQRNSGPQAKARHTLPDQRHCPNPSRRQDAATLAVPLRMRLRACAGLDPSGRRYGPIEIVRLRSGLPGPRAAGCLTPGSATTS